MAPTARTTQGVVSGEQNGGVAVFRGIPYARPPIGELRFRPPQPPERWEGVLDASRFRSIAMQNPSPLEAIFGAAERPPMSEDCLFLNVWTPIPSSTLQDQRPTDSDGPATTLNVEPGTRLPVMVWIHGGAFVGGAGSTPWYDGTAFATRGNVVLVTLNYRLGAFGFLHLAELGGTEFAGSGNAGILDQVAALRWVRDNIAALGGDPENVTIFGESAGAMSVGTLLGLPEASGLFRRAILQSGGAGNIKTAEAATAIARQIIDALEPAPEDVEALRHIPAEALLKAQAVVSEANRGSGIPFEPVIDGTVLPRPVLDTVAAGDAAGVSMLAGTTLDEMKLFTAFDPTAGVSDEAELRRRCVGIFGSDERSTAAVAAYQRARPDQTPGDVWSAIMTDQVFRVPAVRLLDRQSRHQQQTWAYLFTWASPAFGGRLGSCHALEIPFVFNTLDAPGAAGLTGGTTPEMRALAERMQDAWISFARTGDPNHSQSAVWPRYDAARRGTMLFGERCEPSEKLYAELALWDDLAAGVEREAAPAGGGL